MQLPDQADQKTPAMSSDETPSIKKNQMNSKRRQSTRKLRTTKGSVRTKKSQFRGEDMSKKEKKDGLKSEYGQPKATEMSKREKVKAGPRSEYGTLPPKSGEMSKRGKPGGTKSVYGKVAKDMEDEELLDANGNPPIQMDNDASVRSMKVPVTENNTRIPKTFNNVVEIAFSLEETVKMEDLVFSYSMVVRSINRSCPLASFLVVGDQILEVENQVITSPETFLAALVNGKQKMLVIRPWNVFHCADRIPAKWRKDCYYSIVEVHKDTGTSTGFDLKSAFKKCIVTKVTPGSRGGHAFMTKDRILDVDGQNASSLDSQQIRKKFRCAMDSKRICTFLVERETNLRSSTNVSLTSMRAMNPPDPSMGDDASEIGAREATRIMQMKGKYQPNSVLREGGTYAMPPKEMESDSRRGSKREKKKKMIRFKGRCISIDMKPETSRTPTDVVDVSSLQKVTARSGIIQFVRNVLSK